MRWYRDQQKSSQCCKNSLRVYFDGYVGVDIVLESRSKQCLHVLIKFKSVDWNKQGKNWFEQERLKSNSHQTREFQSFPAWEGWPTIRPFGPKQTNLIFLSSSGQNSNLLPLQHHTKDLKNVAYQIVDQFETESDQTELCEEFERTTNRERRCAFRERGDQSVLGEEQAIESSDIALRALPATDDLASVDHASCNRPRSERRPVRVRHLAAADQQQLGKPIGATAGALS